MSVEIENDNMVIGYLDGREVMKVGIYSRDKWSVGSSSCLSSDIETARTQLDLMNDVFATMDDLIREKAFRLLHGIKPGN